MNTQTLILAILNFGDASGYEIKKRSTEGPFSYFVDFSFGSIYPALARLEQRGLVTATKESQDGKPDKKIYSVTESGRFEFLEALKKPVQRDKFKSEFLLIAMCAELTDKRVIARAIDDHVSDIEAEIDAISGIPEECMNGDQTTGTSWIAEYGLHMKHAAMEFLTKNRCRLVGIAKDKAGLKEAAE